MTFGLDYSAAHPDLNCAKANGVGFVVRYLEPADNWKTLTPVEAAQIKAAGIDLVSCFEARAADPLGGFNVGVDHARGVAAESVKVGMPATRPVYFAVDFDATAAQLAGPVRDYFRGIATVLPVDRIGGYGSVKAIRYLFDNGLIRWGWQTYAWSGGQWDSRAQLQQYNNSEAFCGGTVDFNRSTTDDFGQWSRTVTTFPYGYGAVRLTWDQLMAKQTVYKVHPELIRRFRALTEFAATQGVSLGVGTGWRIQPRNKPGFAAPGNSNHEGFPADGVSGGAVAIDVVPSESWDWMERNAAAYGLRTFRHVNNEPWHIQPVEIPSSRNRRSTPWTLPVFQLPNQKPSPPAPSPTPPPVPVPEPEDDDIMYLAIFDGGSIVVVGSSVRPVSLEEVQGPYKDLERFTLTPGTPWYNWIKAAAAEYTQRVSPP